jgi:hypothetical protein
LQQRRFSRAARPRYRNELAARDREVDPSQNLDGLAGLNVTRFQTFDVNHSGRIVSQGPGQW